MCVVLGRRSVITAELLTHDGCPALLSKLNWSSGAWLPCACTWTSLPIGKTCPSIGPGGVLRAERGIRYSPGAAWSVSRLPGVLLWVLTHRRSEHWAGKAGHRDRSHETPVLCMISRPTHHKAPVFTWVCSPSQPDNVKRVALWELQAEVSALQGQL